MAKRKNLKENFKMQYCIKYTEIDIWNDDLQ